MKSEKSEEFCVMMEDKEKTRTITLKRRVWENQGIILDEIMLKIEMSDSMREVLDELFSNPMYAQTIESIMNFSQMPKDTEKKHFQRTN